MKKRPLCTGGNLCQDFANFRVYYFRYLNIDYFLDNHCNILSCIHLFYTFFKSPYLQHNQWFPTHRTKTNICILRKYQTKSKLKGLAANRKAKWAVTFLFGSELSFQRRHLQHCFTVSLVSSQLPTIYNKLSSDFNELRYWKAISVKRIEIRYHFRYESFVVEGRLFVENS